MVYAYALIEMAAGHSRNLVSALEGHANIEEATRVTGPYDVIVVLKGEDLDQVTEAVTNQIHTMEGVVRTTTCVALN